MIEYYLAGGLLRGAQILVNASIWIVCGCFISAIFRDMIGADKTRVLFGNNSRFGPLIGWAIGMLLPVCSLGAIPVVRQLHRAGVKPGTIIAFGLTAPLFNPLSVLYGLSLADPIAVVVFSAAAMVIVTGLGSIWGNLFRQMNPADSCVSNDIDQVVASTGIRRSLSVIHHASTELNGWSIVFIAIGILGSVVMTVAFSHGSLTQSAEPDNLLAPALMACYITPIYTTPLLAMSQIGGMFQHGNSIGAAFSLLVLGAGVNIGVFCWFGVTFGIRRVLVFLVLLLSLTIALAYAMDKPLYPKGADSSGHTHAFDVYTHPFRKGEVGLLNNAVDEIQQFQKSKSLGGLYLLMGLGLLGIGIRIAESRWDFKSWYEIQNKNRVGWDIALPAWLVGVIACLGLIALSVFGTYIYYPNSKTLLEDLSVINTTCVVAAKTGDWEVVEKWTPYCDDLSRRLEVGVFLRNGKVSEFRKAKVRVYREKLDELRDNVEAGQTENIDGQAMDLHRTFQQLKRAFQNN